MIHCAIWYHLYNLKNVKNTYRGVFKKILTYVYGDSASFVMQTFSTLPILDLSHIDIGPREENSLEKLGDTTRNTFIQPSSHDIGSHNQHSSSLQAQNSSNVIVQKDYKDTSLSHSNYGQTALIAQTAAPHVSTTRSIISQCSTANEHLTLTETFSSISKSHVRNLCETLNENENELLPQLSKSQISVTFAPVVTTYSTSTPKMSAKANKGKLIQPKTSAVTKQNNLLTAIINPYIHGPETRVEVLDSSNRIIASPSNQLLLNNVGNFNSLPLNDQTAVPIGNNVANDNPGILSLINDNPVLMNGTNLIRSSSCTIQQVSGNNRVISRSNSVPVNPVKNPEVGPHTEDGPMTFSEMCQSQEQYWNLEETPKTPSQNVIVLPNASPQPLISATPKKLNVKPGPLSYMPLPPIDDKGIFLC